MIFSKSEKLAHKGGGHPELVISNEQTANSHKVGSYSATVSGVWGVVLNLQGSTDRKNQGKMPSLTQIFQHRHVTRWGFVVGPLSLGLIPKVVVFFLNPGRFFCLQSYKRKDFHSFLLVVFFWDISFFQRMFEDEMLHFQLCFFATQPLRPCGRCFFEMCLWARASVLRRGVVFFFSGTEVLEKKPSLAIAGRVHQIILQKTIYSISGDGSKMDKSSAWCSKTLDLSGPIRQSSRYLKYQHIGWLLYSLETGFSSSETCFIYSFPVFQQPSFKFVCRWLCLSLFFEIIS